jgi:hypothetical protein
MNCHKYIICDEVIKRHKCIICDGVMDRHKSSIYEEVKECNKHFFVTPHITYNLLCNFVKGMSTVCVQRYKNHRPFCN